MQWERPQQLFARAALTHHGWQENVLVEMDTTGLISRVTPNAQMPAGIPSFDLLLPGMSNVHSHAFQRAMAGLTETAGGSNDDNFWSWRQVMYRFKQRLKPSHVEAIAQYLYIELLKQGYTAVGEFHYLHNDASGTPYADRTELSQRIITAAQASGIHLTLLPVYYEASGFGGKPATEGQERFIHTPDDFLALIRTLKSQISGQMNLGIAPHSLRAVSGSSLNLLLNALPALGMEDCPVHIHVSEQMQEVEDCMAWSGKRPVQWLLDNAPVAENWCLVHATHAGPQELAGIAERKAVVGLCPTTEANLGDGIFPAADYLRQDGRFAIGSDSNVCVSPWDELRQMEYAQRLATRRRNVLVTEATPSVGYSLYTQAAMGGAQALGLKGGAIAPGRRADLVAVDTSAPLFAGKKWDQWLDTLIFILQAPPVSHVWIAGRCVIENGHHRLEEQSAHAWRNTIREIMQH